MNLSSLASDTGISRATADAWLSVLQPDKTSRSWLVYGGDSVQRRENVTVLPWHGLAPLLQEI